MQFPPGMALELTETIMSKWKGKNPDYEAAEYNRNFSRVWEALNEAGQEGSQQLLTTCNRLVKEVLGLDVELKISGELEDRPFMERVDDLFPEEPKKFVIRSQDCQRVPYRDKPSKGSSRVNTERRNKARAQRKKVKKHRKRGR